MHKKVLLKNGARLILIPQENTKAVTVLVLFRVGSRYEHHKISGVSHFIEHMMFKGTARRPSTTIISRTLDSVGAEYNAFTGKDYTGYYIKIDARHTDLALDMLEDMLFHSKFDETEFHRERKVIHEEIHMYRDNPMYKIEEIMEEEIFAGNTLGWPIAGTEETMNLITRPAMLSFLESYYVPARTVIIVAGKLNNHVEELASNLFGSFKGTAQGKEFKKFIPKPKGAPHVKIEYKDTEQAQLALGFPAYKYLDKNLPALKLLGVVLGGTMSSRLFISVRERKGLAYYVKAAVDTYEDTGSFQVRAGLAKGRMEEAIKTIMKELEKMKKRGVSQEELKRAKENIRGRLAIDLEESSEIASFYGKQELFINEILTPEQKVQQLLQVTQEEISRVANDVLQKNKLSLAIIGPYKDNTLFSKLLK